MVKTIHHFLEFCYLVRRSSIDEDGLAAVDREVAAFRRERVVFQEEGVRPDGISLPRQHSMGHYRPVIQDFAAANGLCSSITESKHIKAVKDPWRRTNKHNAVDQILTINERLDKLAASRQDFRARGMLKGSYWDKVAEEEAEGEEMDEDEDEGPVDGLNITAEVKLARKAGTSIEISIYQHLLLHSPKNPTGLAFSSSIHSPASPPRAC